MSLIHFFNYLDYDSLLDLGLAFSKPTKTADNTYLAKLEKPVFFILPKSEILDVHQDSFGNNICRYIVNLEEHGEFLTFLDNLDSLCVNIAADYSLEWFKQKKDSKQLVSRYSSTYIVEEDNGDELVTCDIEVKDLEQLNDLNLYNEDDNLNILVSIEGIEFFKQSFKWKLSVDSLVDELEDEEKEEPFDFTNVLEKDEKVVNTLEKTSHLAKPLELVEKKDKESIVKKNNKTKLDIETQSKLNGIDKTSISMSEVINKEVIAELADVANIEKTKNIDIRSTLSNIPKTKVSDKLSINELESIITQKKNESKEYLLNAERAKRASEGLYQKGMEAANEIKRYEERLQELSQTTSIISQRR